MGKKFLAILSTMAIMAMLLLQAAPVFADVAPNGANSNSPTVAVNRPAIVYHVGDVIHYEVVVGNPAPSGTAVPAYQTLIAVSFDPISDGANSDGTGDDTPLATIASLLPGESVTFTATGATYIVYHQGDGSPGNPTRAQLTQANTLTPMPASPTYDTDTTTYAGSYPILNHTILLGELFLSNGVYQETAIAHILDGPVNVGPGSGAHDAPSFVDSNDKLGSITTGVSIPGTTTTISSNATTVIAGQSVTLTVTENNTGDVDLTSPHVVVLKNGAAFMDLVAPPTSGDIHLPTGTLNGSSNIGAELWTWVIDSGPLTDTTTFQATGHGFDDSNTDITVPAYPDEQDSVTINTSSTAVTIVPAATTVITGTGTTLTVTESNPGTVPLTSPRVELTGGLVLTLNHASATFVAGSDPNSNSILDVGETWQWTGIATGALTTTTTFTATGHGTDPALNDVTAPAVPGEQASANVNVSSTAVTIVPAATTVITGTGTTLTVTESNPGTVPLTSPRVELTGGLVLTLTHASATFVAGSDPNSNSILDVGETWQWTGIATGALTTTTTFTATGHGTDPALNDVTAPAVPGEQASANVNVSSTAVTIVPAATTVITGTGTTLTVTESNPGTVPLTSPRVELTGGLVLTLTHASATFVAGSDPNSNSILDVGETWQWTGIATGALTATTTFTATGHGTDPALNDVTAPAVPGEQASANVNVSSTAVTIVPAATTVITGTGTTLTVTESNPGTVPLTSPRVELTGGLVLTLTHASATFVAGSDPNSNSILDVGETWQWTGIATGALTTTTTFTATGHGTDPALNDVTAPAVPGEQASANVNVSSTAVTIVPAATTVITGTGTTLTVTESNPGTVPLTSPRVELTGGLVLTLTHASATFVAGSDPNSNSILDVGETWQWTGIATGALTATTTFTATGHGTDPALNDVTAPAVPGEQASANVNVSSTAVTIVPAATTVITGTGTTLTVTESNPGTVPLTSPRVELTGGLVLTLTHASATFVAGSDPNSNSILDVGETWQWTGIATGALTTTTTFTATGHGTDPALNDVTAPAVPGEQASANVNVSSTAVTIVPAATTVITGTGTTLTVTESNPGTVPLTSPRVELTGGLVLTLTHASATFVAGSDPNSNSILDVGETWQWTGIATGDLTTTTTFTATGHGTDPALNDVTAPAVPGEQASANVNVSSTAVTIVPAATTVITGTDTTLTVTESNPGTVPLTSPRVELTGGLVLTLTHASATFVAGSDPNSNSILDVGETWQWTGIATGALTATTTFTATGHGTDPALNDVTAPAVPGEQASANVNVSSTAVTIVPAATTVITGTGTTLTVTESNPGTVPLTSPRVELTGGLVLTLTHASATFVAGSDPNSNSILDVGETWQWTGIATGALTATTTFTATGHGTDPALNDVTAPAVPGEQASANVNVSSTAVTIVPAATTVITGTGTTLTVTESNPGTVPLTSPRVELTGGLVLTLTHASATFVAGSDPNSNSILDVGETWQWTGIATGALTATTTFTATGHGTDPALNDVTAPAVPGEQASANVNVSSTAVTIVPAATTVITGTGTTLTVTESNPGTVPLTSPRVELTGGLVLTLTHASATFVAGSDPNSNSILDVGETWQWTGIATGALTATTTFTATGHGTDPALNDVTAPAVPGEQASANVNVSSTAVTIVPAATTVITGTGTTLTVTESNPGTVPLTSPRVELTGGLVLTLTHASATFVAGSDPNSNSILDVGETWQWTGIATGALTTTTTFTATGHGTDPALNDVTAPAVPGEQASANVNVSSTAVTIVPAATTVITGTGTTLTVTESNPGTVPLTSPRVELTGGLVLTLTHASATFVAGSDPNSNSILDVGETWQWTGIATGALTATTTFTATGHGTDPALNDVTAPAVPGEQASANVNVSSTAVTIVPAATTVITGTGTTLTVTESNPGTVPLTSPRVELTGGLVLTLTHASATFVAGSDPNSNSILDVGETWQWTGIATGALTTTTTFTATGHGTDPALNDVTAPAVPGEQASANVNVSSTAVTIVPAATTVITGTGTTLTVTESNPGTVPLTSPRVELTGGLVLTLTHASATFVAGSDPNSNSILDVGETWQWTGIATGALTATTTFTATGHGTDPALNDVTAPAVPGEQASANVNVSSTAVTIVPAATTVITGTGTTLTVTESNPGTVPLTSPRVELTGGLVLTLTHASATFVAGSDPNSNSILDVGETWQWTGIATGALTTTTTFTATGHGTDPALNDVTAPAVPGEQASANVNVSSTAVTIVPAATTVITGTGTTLTVTESNPGTVPLTSPRVELTGGLVLTLTHASATFVAGSDPNSNSILDVGETWQWTGIATGALTATTTFTATGHGTDPALNDVTAPAVPGEQASANVNVSSTAVTIVPAATTVITGTGTTLTVTESNPGTVPLTSPRVELTGGLVLTLTHASATFVAGSDPNSNSILDVGETWQWTGIATGALTTTTTFTATGHGTDPALNDVTAPAVPGEQASANVNVSSTAVTIVPAATTVITGTGTTLTVTESNPGTVPLTGAHVVVTKNGGAFTDLLAATAVESMTNDDILQVGETWTWSGISTGALTATTTFEATGHGTDPALNDVTYPAVPGERNSVTVSVISPNTKVTLNILNPVIDKVIPGTSVTFVVTEQNTGDTQLTNISVDFVGTNDLNVELFHEILTKDSTSFTTGDNADGVMDPGEIWQWNVTETINEKTTITATGHGLDPLFNDVTAPGFPDEQAQAVVDILILVPASSDLSIGLMIAGLAGAIVFLMARRTRRSRRLV